MIAGFVRLACRLFLPLRLFSVCSCLRARALTETSFSSLPKSLRIFLFDWESCDEELLMSSPVRRDWLLEFSFMAAAFLCEVPSTGPCPFDFYFAFVAKVGLR